MNKMDLVGINAKLLRSENQLKQITYEAMGFARTCNTAL